MQDAECHHERGNGKKKKTRKYYFSLSVSGLDGIFDVVYGGGDQRERINTNISAVWPTSDPHSAATFSPTPLFVSSFLLLLLFLSFLFGIYQRPKVHQHRHTARVQSHMIYRFSPSISPGTEVKIRIRKKLRNSVQTCSLGGCEPVMAVSYLVTWYSIFAVFSLELPSLRSRTPCLFEDAAGRATGFVLVLVCPVGLNSTRLFTHTPGDSSLLT